ncbi:hypothetical protein AK812_SmicGene28891 [Symbiodinium microadriaticum]|uniref:Uncharacterized protein n=1 Tax=Symbiodinium microadriaticum TaxID=2951 RepID=A0A1Q9D378_SYMMI|nr:hypothetical protein AK812_SmicGene28891 [Symbiodinium microadriaticum]
MEHLIAEVMLKDNMRVNEVIKAIHSDSQAALAVCRTAAGSWRTTHLRIRGSLIRELLEQADWTAHHVDGRVMPTELGAKALSADRFLAAKVSTAKSEPIKKLFLAVRQRLSLRRRTSQSCHLFLSAYNFPGNASAGNCCPRPYGAPGRDESDR